MSTFLLILELFFICINWQKYIVNNFVFRKINLGKTFLKMLNSEYRTFVRNGTGF